MAQVSIPRSRDTGRNFRLHVSNQKPTKMKTYLLKNWKTTLAGVISIAAIVTTTWLPQYADELAKLVGLLVSLGLIAAKDGDKTGL